MLVVTVSLGIKAWHITGKKKTLLKKANISHLYRRVVYTTFFFLTMPGTEVNALATHLCGPGPIPGVGTCGGLWLPGRQMGFPRILRFLPAVKSQKHHDRSMATIDL